MCVRDARRHGRYQGIEVGNVMLMRRGFVDLGRGDGLRRF